MPVISTFGAMSARGLGFGASPGGLKVQDVFDIDLWTGTSANQNISTTFAPDFAWIKQRDAAGYHSLYDTTRGANNLLNTNTTAAQTTYGNTLTAFNSNGYSLGNDAVQGWVNNAGGTYVGWSFKEADRFFKKTSVSHTNGSNTTVDLSSLGTVGMAVAKITNTTGDWIVWHLILTTSNNLRLNTMAAQTTTNAWLSVSGTTLTLSSSAPTGTYIVYGWAHDPTGIIQCGSFTTDGSGNATVSLGWEPQWLLVKPSSTTGNWIILDQTRGWGSTDYALFPNLSNVESSATDYGAPSGSGFSFANGGNTVTWVYMAIRKGPM